MTATETPAAGERRGSTSPAAGHHDWLLKEMNRQSAAGIPNVDNAGHLTVIGQLEGDRCSDCGDRIPGDVELCDICAGEPDEEPHPYPCPTCGGNGCPSCGDTGERIEYTR